MSLGAADMTSLIASAIAWLAVAVSLIVSLVRRKSQGPGWPLMGAGLLVMITGALLSQVAVIRQWPYSQRGVVDGMNMVLDLAGGACVVASRVAQGRSRRHEP